MKRILGIYKKHEKLELSHFKEIINSISHLKNTDTSETIITDYLYLSTYTDTKENQSFFSDNNNIYTYAGLIYFDNNPENNAEIEIQKYHLIKKDPADTDTIKGSYNIVKFDKENNELYLYNNLIRGFPLYWFENDETLIFCNDYEPLVKYGSNKYDINIEAIYDYLISGAPTSSETFFNNIHILAPGDQIIVKNSKIEIKKNKKRLQVTNNKDSVEKNAKEYFNTLKSETNQMISWNQNIPITITGGADTRIILGTLSPDKIGSLEFITFIAKRDTAMNSSDIKIAKELTDFYNLNHSLINQNLYRITNVDREYFRNIMDNTQVMFSGIYGSETLRFYEFYEQLPVIIKNTLDRKHILQNIKQYNTEKESLAKYLCVKSSKSYLKFRSQIFKSISFIKNCDQSLPYTLMYLSHSFFSSQWNGASGNHILPLSVDRYLFSPFITENVVKKLFSIPKEQLTPEEHGICNTIFKNHLQELAKFESNSDLCEYDNSILKKSTRGINIPQHINYNNIESALENKYISDLKIFNLKKIKEDFSDIKNPKSYVWFDLILWLDYISSL